MNTTDKQAERLEIHKRRARANTFFPRMNM